MHLFGVVLGLVCRVVFCRLFVDVFDVACLLLLCACLFVLFCVACFVVVWVVLCLLCLYLFVVVRRVIVCSFLGLPSCWCSDGLFVLCSVFPKCVGVCCCMCFFDFVARCC